MRRVFGLVACTRQNHLRKRVVETRQMLNVDSMPNATPHAYAGGSDMSLKFSIRGRHNLFRRIAHACRGEDVDARVA